MKLFHLLLNILVLFLATSATAQQIFEDASGESSLYIADSNFGYVRLNTSSSSATLGYNNFTTNGYNLFDALYWVYGGDVSVSVKDKVGQLFKDDKVQPDVSLNGNVGLASDKISGLLLSAFVRGEFGNKNFDMLEFDPDTAMVAKKNRWARKITFNINAFHQYGDDDDHPNFLSFGLSYGRGKKYNYSDLDDGEILATQQGLPYGSVVGVKKGKLGALGATESNPFRIDLGILPTLFKQNKVGFNTYYTIDTFTKLQKANWE